MIEEKKRVVDAGIEEDKIKPGNLTSIAKHIGKNLKSVTSLIVITDNVFWETFWKEQSNKIHNKLEELLDDDEEDDGIEFTLVVVCNINQHLLTSFPSFTSKATVISEDEKYLEHGSKTCHMVVTMENNNQESIETLAKQIVDKFNNQNCSSSSKDQVDTVTPVQTPTENKEPQFLKVEVLENFNQGKAPDLSTKPNDEDEISKESGINFVAGTNTDDKVEEDNSYPLKNPGLCLYIGLLEFDADSEKAEVSLENRHSSSKEFQKMKDSFENLGCFVKKKLNPTAEQAIQFLQEGINWCKKLKPSFFVLIISTHGQEVPMVIKEDNKEPHEQHPSGITVQKKPRTEMVHQLFFHNGKSLLTRDIIRMFDQHNCSALEGKPCLFFIQSCRSRFGLDGHENFDPGVMVNVLTAENDIRAGLKSPDSVDASSDTSHQDTTDAKRSTTKQTEEDKEARLKQIQEWNKKAKLAVLHRHILDYNKYLMEHRTISLLEAQGTDNEIAIKLFETLLSEGLTIDQINEIKEECKGFEQEILDFFFPEPIISDPPPCVNDALVMFASAPGKEAYNRDKQGGWLITNLETQLKETLETKPEKIDLLAELTKVSGRIAYKYETDTGTSESSGHKSVPCLYHKLSRDVIIWPEEIKNAKELYEGDPDGELKDFLKWIRNQ
ncbi:uncharacterized protein LOC133192159 [Saccostrea echinata]|uniref:uncharacterized protein LOC133192159 n=1 Tax=Saccostrea echinata TaxID=191078 RepID=UPI002A81717F|nr:uncharacterized protein LOC133192159 [Saccostrea echinata]